MSCQEKFVSTFFSVKHKENDLDGKYMVLGALQKMHLRLQFHRWNKSDDFFFHLQTLGAGRTFQVF